VRLYLLFGLAIAALVLGPSSSAPVAESNAAARLTRAKMAGDMDNQRRHLWAVLARIVASGRDNHHPAFLDWPGEREVFAAQPQRTTGFPDGFVRSRTANESSDAGDPPLIRFIHYNPAAARHIRQQGLYRETTLRQLRASGPPHPEIAGNRTIAPLPRDAVVVMTAWWPVAADGLTPLPVWDADGRHRAQGSNSYLNWPRLVAVTPDTSRADPSARQPVAFAGRVLASPTLVPLDRLVHVPVTPTLAHAAADTPEAAKLSLLALGRPLQAGDFLALVGMHVMTAQISGGTWGTFWWHDSPATGPFATARPSDLPAPWRNYLMDATFDAVLPREADGTPNVCFNPWLDGGLGANPHASGQDNDMQNNGMQANCISCHNRASYPLIEVLPVTRGHPDVERDRAYAADQLRTGMLWSIANSSYKQFQGQDLLLSR